MDENNLPVAPEAKPAKSKRTFKKPKTLHLVVVILLVVAIATAGFFYTKYRDSQYKLKHPDVVVKNETQDLVDKVGRLSQLPTGEEPTVATVSDVSKLSSQTFFAKAQNGDKVLIYSKAKQAILYRPSTDKVVNIAPLNIDSK